MESTPRKKGGALLVLALALAMAGCVTNYKDQVVSFQKSFDSAGEIMATYYQDANRMEREYYLQVSLYENSELYTKILKDPGAGAPQTPPADGGTAETGKTFVKCPKGNKPDACADTAVSPTFAIKGLKQRLETIRLLRIYAALLARLAGADGAPDTGSAAKDLAEKGKDIASQWKDRLDRDWSGLFTAFAEIAQEADTAHRRKILARTITQHSKLVENALTTLKDAFEKEVSQRLRLTTRALLNLHFQRYNKMVKKDAADIMAPPADAQKKAIEEIGRLAQRRDLLDMSCPGQLSALMLTAHNSLVIWAESDMSAASNAQLTMALKLFEEEVTYVDELTKKLAALK